MHAIFTRYFSDPPQVLNSRTCFICLTCSNFPYSRSGCPASCSKIHPSHQISSAGRLPASTTKVSARRRSSNGLFCERWNRDTGRATCTKVPTWSKSSNICLRLRVWLTVLEAACRAVGRARCSPRACAELHRGCSLVRNGHACDINPEQHA